ncbi:MAG TPA: hypothetical protein VHB25_10405 [Gemmatimonadaceae bacterium]|nr:hypothetical protein [Gemmatimonadaceae bacterium]
MLDKFTTAQRALLAVAACAALGACSRGAAKAEKQRIASGDVDSAAVYTTNATPAAGPGVQVTRTDAKSVTKATEYELTDSNFTRFMAAADSVSALEVRDSTVRSYLSANITDAGSTDADAGLKYLEANARVNNAIASAGMSTKDYFVASIAIAAAQRFMQNPKDAPPTPTLSKNAAFLRTHQLDLDKLQAERDGKPVVTATP